MDNIRLKKYYPVVFLTIIIVIASALLVITEKVTWRILALQQDAETLALLQQVCPEAYYYAYDEKSGIYTVYNESREKDSYAFYGQDLGYQSKIIVLIGLQDAETIKNVIIIEENETPIYFQKVTNSDFMEQFVNLKIENCIPTYSWSSSEGVDMVSGASYSSKGIINAVKEAVLEKIQYLN